MTNCKVLWSLHRDEMYAPNQNLVWMFRLISPYMFQEGMKSFITYLMSPLWKAKLRSGLKMLWVSRYNTWVIFVYKIECISLCTLMKMWGLGDLFSILSLMEAQLTYNITFVSGAGHDDSVCVYFAEWSP